MLLLLCEIEFQIHMTYDTQDGKNLIIRCFCSSKKVSCVWFGSCEHSLVYSSGICIDFVCEVEEEEDKEKKNFSMKNLKDLYVECGGVSGWLVEVGDF